MELVEDQEHLSKPQIVFSTDGRITCGWVIRFAHSDKSPVVELWYYHNSILDGLPLNLVLDGQEVLLYQL